MSYSCRSTMLVARPSCGRRFSEISSPLTIFILAISAACRLMSCRMASCSTPSTRNRIRTWFSIGSIWISLALLWTACSMICPNSLTIGACWTLFSSFPLPGSKAALAFACSCFSLVYCSATRRASALP